MVFLHKTRTLYVCILLFFILLLVPLFADVNDPNSYTCCVSGTGIFHSENTYVGSQDPNEVCQQVLDSEATSRGLGTFCVPDANLGITQSSIEEYAGCCTFGVNQGVGVASQTFCVDSNYDTPTFQTRSERLTILNANNICVEPIDDDDESQASCAQAGGFWCLEGDSRGSVIGGPFSDSLNYPDSVCYDQPCISDDQDVSCSDLGGVFCSTFEVCTNPLDGSISDECCQDLGSCEQMSCTQYGATECPTNCAQNVGDITSLVTLSNSNYVCCDAPSPNSACAATEISTSCLVDPTQNHCIGVVKGTISGIPTQFIGTPMRVTVQSLRSGTFEDRSIRVTRSGTYEIRNLAVVDLQNDLPQEYRVRLSIEGDDLRAEDPIREITLNFETFEKTVNFAIEELEFAAIRGRILDENNNGISNAWVFILRTLSRTDSIQGGNYTLTNILPGTYTIRAGKSGFESQERQITVQESDLGNEIPLDFTLGGAGCVLNIPRPVFQTPEFERGTLGINLSWSISCENDARSIIVQRCSDRQSQCSEIDFVTIQTLSSSARTYFDSNGALEWGEIYTYRLAVDYGGADPVYSTLLQVYSGDEACDGITTNDHFCVNDQDGHYCDAQNQKTAHAPAQCSENAGEFCRLTQSGNQMVSACYREDGCLQELRSDNPLGFITRSACEGLNSNLDDLVCYYDKGRTTVNTCLTCKSEMTCFQYQTEGACERNVCGVDQGSGCSWIPSQGSTGLGVCVDNQEPLCEQCEDDESSQFGFCDRNTCLQLGTLGGASDVNACYHDSEAFECLNCNEVTCYDYVSPQACVGAGSLIIDSRTNEIIQSPDHCGAGGACAWLNDKCVRDFTRDGRDDCQEYINDATLYEQCTRDNVPPISFVHMPLNVNPNFKTFDIHFIAVDRGSQVEDQIKEVRLCIGSSPQDCDVAREFASLGDDMSIEISSAEVQIDGRTYMIEDGVNTLYYYAIDFANNYEIVNTQNFTAHLRGPELTISTDVIPGNYETSAARSDVQVMIESNRLTQCEIDLVGCEQTDSCRPAGERRSTSFTNEHFLFLPSIYDGIYTIKATCNDEFDNEVVETAEVIVNADPRAFDPRPLGPQESGTVELSVRTVDDSVLCRYTDDIDLSDTGEIVMDRQQDGTAYKHYAQLSNLEEGTYTYYVVCDFSPVSVQT
ncbi:MAG: carboxypeptidase regulatory-like domain-containing protein, partial [Candidatus Woesearchaeota archaeon]